ncbi:DUF2971 domain-containing protein [Cellulosimicrobium cellulans]
MSSPAPTPPQPDSRADIVRIVEEAVQAEYQAWIACFSVERDLLSQWRGYADGGYSLQFRGAMLENLDVTGLPHSWVEENPRHTEPHAPTARMVEVIYGDDGKRLAAEMSQELTAPNQTIDGPHAFLREQAMDKARDVLAQAKHPGFSEEREWRLVVTPGDYIVETEHRTTARGSLVPYVRVPVPLSEALASVMVGPGLPPQAVDAVREMLTSKGLADVEVHTSSLPFRST